jgi:MYXO-CTERM domain-containing protein
VCHHRVIAGFHHGIIVALQQEPNPSEETAMFDLIQDLLRLGVPDNQDPSLWTLGLAAAGAALLMSRRQKRD